MSAARNLVLGVFGAGAAGYGVYFASQFQEVSKFEGEEKQAVSLIEKERKASVAAKKNVEAEEQRIATLKKSDQEQQASLKQAQAKVESALKALSEAEAAYSKQQESGAKLAKDLATATSKLANLKAEESRAKEAITMGESECGRLARVSDTPMRMYARMGHPCVTKLAVAQVVVRLPPGAAYAACGWMDCCHHNAWPPAPWGCPA